MEKLERVPVDLLPCTIESKDDELEAKRGVYFDPLTQIHPDGMKTVSLQGRKLEGKEMKLADIGYQGVVFATTTDEIEPETLERKVVMQPVANADKVTIWQKDKYGENEFEQLFEYIQA